MPSTFSAGTSITRHKVVASRRPVLCVFVPSSRAGDPPCGILALGRLFPGSAEEIAKTPWSLPAQTLEAYQLPDSNTVATSTGKLHGPQPHLEARSRGREGALAVSMGAVLLEITAYLIGSFRHEPDKPDVQVTKLMTKPT
jgi:hypothetical protein